MENSINLIEKAIILTTPHIIELRNAIFGFTNQTLASYYVLIFQIPYLMEYKLRQNNFALLKRILTKRSSYTKEDMKRLEKAWSQDHAIENMLNYYKYLVQAQFIFFYEHEKNYKIDIPILMISAENDNALLWNYAEKGIKKHCKNGIFKLYKNTSHFFQRDHHELLNFDIENFIK
jgi:pimeloyl-ACP methyl ester carboxylesterase